MVVDLETNLGLGGDVEVARGTGLTAKADLLLLAVGVLLNVLVGTLEDDLPLGTAGLKYEDKRVSGRVPRQRGRREQEAKRN